MAKELKVGIVGMRRGMDFRQGLAACAGTAVAAICDTNPEHLEAARPHFPHAKAFADYSEMLESGIDMVIVATPIHLHAPMCAEALRQGIHALSEVSAAISLEQCRELVSAARASSAKYMMAENCCYFKPYVLVKSMARAGLFGDIYYGEGDYVHELRETFSAPTWRRDYLGRRRGGTYITHPLGPILEWMNDRVVTVTCLGSGHHVLPELAMDDVTILLCRTAKGGLIQIRNDMLSPRPHTHNYVALQGTGGAYEAARHKDDTHRVCLASSAGPHQERAWQSLWDFEQEYLPAFWRASSDEVARAGHGGSDYFLVQDFVDAILNDTVPPLDIYRALDFTVPGLISEVSIQQGGAPVAVPDFRQM